MLFRCTIFEREIYIRMRCHAFLGDEVGGALLRALRVRVGACLAVVQCLDEMTRFLAAECSC
jgi:hypothetical protein